jgi:opacity protein-like surface antigen
MSTRCFRIALVLVALIPSRADSDWLFTPALGYTFGGDTVDRNHRAYVFAAGWLDEEAFGLELDFAYSPSFFDGTKGDFTGTGNVMTVMGNIVLTAPGNRILPYVSGGAGYMRMRVTSDAGTFITTVREPGFNAGAGLVAFVAPVIGARLDVRYVRSFVNQVPSWTRGVDVDLAPSAFDFWRAFVGVTLRIPE